MRNSTLWRGTMLSLLIYGMALSLAYAQERMVTGKVSSAEEGALPGVNIIIQGTGQGTVSDIEGNFSITVPGPESVLVFSSIGYTTEAVTVGNQSVIDMVLVADVTSLKEIVVTGYASQEKKDLTGAVGVVKPEELTAMPQGNIVNQLQGRIAGVNITQDSRPGETARIRIRGISSISGANDPLYIVDGVPTGSIAHLNPEDVESLSVLKDAGAASIYGSRASNGVVVVTTKKGTKGAARVTYNMYVGQQDPGKGPIDNILTSDEYADLTWQVLKNQNLTAPINHPLYGTFDPSNPGEPGTPPSWAAETNWWDEITNPALIMNHDIALSGGNDNASFYGSLGYFDQGGVTIYNFYKRYSARFNSEFKIKDRVTIGENMSVMYWRRNNVSNQDEGTPLMNTYRLQSLTPVIVDQEIDGITHYFMPGDWGGTGIAAGMGNQGNYVSNRTRSKDNLGQDIRIIGNVYADVKILEGLNFRTSIGGNWGQWYWTNWQGATYENAENRATSTYQEGSGWGSEWTWTNTLTYNKQFGDHRILAVGGYESVKTGIGRGMDATRGNYFSEDLSYRTLNNGANIIGANSYYNTPRTLVSSFIRADYNFKEKYYLSGTFRRDGASVFGSENKWGNFPSVSAAWRITEEGFLSGATFMPELKIRGGYGTMGNQLPVSPQNQYYLYGGGIGDSYYDLNGTGNSSLQGFRPTTIGNDAVKWETNVYTNIGFDAGFFNNTLEVVFDWYSRTSQDLLFRPEVPAIYGAATAPVLNIGEMRNSGIDMQIIYKRIWSDFNFSANATMTTYSNEIVGIAPNFDFFDAGGSRIGSFSRSQVGRSIGEFFGYNVIGLFQTDAEVSGAPVQTGAEPGFFRYENVDTEATVTDDTSPDFGRQVINPDDRTFIGNPHPDFTYGLNLDFGWKNFDLSAFFYGSQGNEIFNYNKWWLDFWPSFQGQKSTDLLYRSWLPNRTDTEVPKASNISNFSTNTQSTSYYVEDGSFLRLRQIQLGYTFPKATVGNVFSNLRVYVQGVNLFTITGYSGMDPEMSYSGESSGDNNFGVDRGNIPVVKQYLFGINMGF
jgi:TonB-dependent starch-binding outer membrane protein SusC